MDQVYAKQLVGPVFHENIGELLENLINSRLSIIGGKAIVAGGRRST